MIKVQSDENQMEFEISYGFRMADGGGSELWGEVWIPIIIRGLIKSNSDW